MAIYHLHSISIFLHYQIRFSCAHARVLAFEYKSVFFPCCTCTCWYVFKNVYTDNFLEDRPISEMSKFAKKRQVPVHRTSSLYQEVDTIAAVAHMLYFAKLKWPDWRKSVGTLINLFIAGVCCSLIQQFVEMYTILKQISLKWRFQHFLKLPPYKIWGIFSQTPAPIAQLVECPLRGTGGHGFDPGPRHTKVVKNGTSCSSLGTQTSG